MPLRPFSMMRKNGSSALKSSRSLIVVVMMGPDYVHACAARRAKSANSIGGAWVNPYVRTEEPDYGR